MASQPKVTMYHPEVGTLRCAATAVRVHERSGWMVADDIVAVTVPAAGGGVLTTATVFPPEVFDDAVDDD